MSAPQHPNIDALRKRFDPNLNQENGFISEQNSFETVGIPTTKPTFVPASSVIVEPGAKQTYNSSTDFSKPVTGNVASAQPMSNNKGEVNDPKSPKSKAFRKKWYWIIAAIAGACLLALGAYLAMIMLRPVDNYTDVSADISGSESASIGSIQEWQVEVFNHNPVEIRDVDVTFNFDSAFKFNRSLVDLPFNPQANIFVIGTLPANQSKIVKFNGSLIGAADTISSITGNVTYKVTNTARKELQQSFALKQFDIKITAPELKAEITKDRDTLEQGTDFSYTLTLANISTNTQPQLKIIANYPDNNSFKFVSSNFTQGTISKNKPDEQSNVWYVDGLTNKSPAVIKITGRIQDTAATNLDFSFDITAQNKGGDWVKVITSPQTTITTVALSLSLSTYIENKDKNQLYKPDEDLTFTIVYKNKSTKSIDNAVIKATVNDPASTLDWTTFQTKSGSPSVNDKTVVWQGSSLSELVSIPAGFEGKISFTVRSKKATNILNSSFTQDQYYLQPAAEISATDRKPLAVTSDYKYSLVGQFGFIQTVQIIDPKDSTAFSKDTEKDFEVAKVTWKFNSAQNKLKNINVSTGTPIAGAWNVDSVKPSDLATKFTYTDRTGAIVLDLTEVDNYLGLSKSALEISFELKVKPVNNTYSGVTVLKENNITAIDQITGETYNVKIEPYVIK